MNMPGPGMEMPGKQQGEDNQVIENLRNSRNQLREFIQGLDPARVEEFKEKAAKKIEKVKEELRKLNETLKNLELKARRLRNDLADSSKGKENTGKFSELMRILEQIEEVKGEIAAKEGKIALWELELD